MWLLQKHKDLLYLTKNKSLKSTIHSSWQQILSDEFSKSYFAELTQFINEEYHQEICYPPRNQIFAALAGDFRDVRVVILGQDPYHNPGQANGFSFSVNENCTFPPSLRNIFKEVSADVGCEIPQHGDLSRWAEQGVLLLNSVLTVRENQPGSHSKKGWEMFTDAVIAVISKNSTNVVYMLWGGYAKKKLKLIDTRKHLVLESGHPSPLSANQGLWFNNKHFTTANTYLLNHGKSPIMW